MRPWEDAWFNGKAMPPHGLPKLLLIEAEAIAEEWLNDSGFRSILEEWVGRDRAEDAVVEILWSGCRLRGEQWKRVPPIPVLVRLTYSEPYPKNIVDLEDQMLEHRRIAGDDWIEQYKKHGDQLVESL